jgi:Protein of unknown function with HXXEE motif
VAAAIGLLPVTVAARGRPALRPLAALLCHQTEEWVWPGSFLPWINREILGSDDDEFPIDRRLGFGINVLFGWGFSLAPLAGPAGASAAATLYVSHLGNAALHLSWAARNRRYDPGTVTSALTLLPVAIVGLRAIAADPDTPAGALRRGAVGGLAVSAALVPALKLRLRRRGRAPAG